MAVLVGLHDHQETKQYTATTTLLFGNAGSSAGSLLNANGNTSASAPNRVQATAVALIDSSAVTSLVVRKLGLKTDPSGDITASAEPDANLIQIAAKDPSPRLAATLANTYASEYETFIRNDNVTGLNAAIASLRTKYATATKLQRATYQASIAALVQAEATASSGVTVVDAAKVPKSPSSPKTKRDIAIGLVLGLALGLVIVLLLDSRDRVLRDSSAVERAYGASSLATVPLRSRGLRGSANALSDRSTEPFRILRAGLGQLGSELSRVVLVTSAAPGEGKSLTAVGLARAWAYTGRPVALVEVDLRKPSFTRAFTLQESTGGVANALRGRADIDQIAEHPIPELPSLAVFPAGGTPARSAELLASPRLTSMLQTLSERYDVVILDAPPLLPVADARTLLDCDLIDVLVVVGRVGVLEREQAERALSLIASHGWTEFQLVTNGASSRETIHQYGSGYGVEPRASELASETISLRDADDAASNGEATVRSARRTRADRGRSGGASATAVTEAEPPDGRATRRRAAERETGAERADDPPAQRNGPRKGRESGERSARAKVDAARRRGAQQPPAPGESRPE